MCATAGATLAGVPNHPQKESFLAFVAAILLLRPLPACFECIAANRLACC